MVKAIFKRGEETLSFMHGKLRTLDNLSRKLVAKMKTSLEMKHRLSFCQSAMFCQSTKTVAE